MTMLQSKIKSINGFSESDKDLLLKALTLQELINNSLELKTNWLTLRPSHNKGLRQSEIYDMIMGGKSRFEKTIDYQLDYALWKYKGQRGTYASTNMSNGNITINSIYFNFLKNRVNGHVYLNSSLSHEAMHSFFGFEDKWPNKRNSVPYTFGRLHRTLGLKHLNNGMKLTPLNKKD